MEQLYIIWFFFSFWQTAIVFMPASSFIIFKIKYPDITNLWHAGQTKDNTFVYLPGFFFSFVNKVSELNIFAVCRDYLKICSLCFWYRPRKHFKSFHFKQLFLYGFQLTFGSFIGLFSNFQVLLLPVLSVFEDQCSSLLFNIPLYSLW